MKYSNEKIQKIDDGFGKAANILAKISGVIMVIMMTVLFVDVVLSKTVNGGVPHSIEMITYFHVPVVYFALLLVQHTEGHATVDLLYTKLPGMVKRVLDILWYVLGIFICGFETYTSWAYTLEKFLSNAMSNTKNGFPIWPFAAAMMLGWLLMGLSYVWCIVRSFFRESAPAEAPADAVQ